MNYPDIVKKHYKTNADLPQIIILLKEAGASQLETAVAIRQSVSISISDLDNLILNAPVWKDMKDSNIQVRDKFFNSGNDKK